MTADVNTKSQSYEIITEDSFKKYDQVFICYGAYDNAKLLINYGFVLTQNINNTYVFTMGESECTYILNYLDLNLFLWT